MAATKRNTYSIICPNSNCNHVVKGQKLGENSYIEIVCPKCQVKYFVKTVNSKVISRELSAQN
jgi:phage FluMu protein Com